MNPFDPVLDRPQVVDHDLLDHQATSRLANQEVAFLADASTDLCDLFWPWSQSTYARRIHIHLRDLQDEDFIPLANQFYPAYQETIYGAEGMIVSKRLMAPVKSGYDRAALWLLECQAEGDRLLRLEVEIDWGEPLTQRIVDGLLVAQRNPRSAQGIYAQHNAESTRVFGNPHARPDSFDLREDGTAHLVYHVLVNGITDVTLLLTVSDVGEQVAWNGFLALRDGQHTFDASVKAWDTLLKAGRLWTPDPRFNRAVQVGRRTAIQCMQRLRTGQAPSDRLTAHVLPLVDLFDACDPVQSHNLLAHLRRAAEKSDGRLPAVLPWQTKAEPEEPDAFGLIEANSAYVNAFVRHWSRHGDAALLGEHYGALRACIDALVLSCHSPAVENRGAQLAQVGQTLRRAIELAAWQDDDVNVARWESEAHTCARLSAMAGQDTPIADAVDLSLPPTWQLRDNAAWGFADPWDGIALAGRAVWQGCGLTRREGAWWVEPAAPWTWWALLNLPIATGSLSLVWDGSALHANQPVHSVLPVVLHDRIEVLHTDEDSFDLTFEFIDKQAEGRLRRRFRPTFLRPPKS